MMKNTKTTNVILLIVLLMGLLTIKPHSVKAAQSDLVDKQALRSVPSTIRFQDIQTDTVLFSQLLQSDITLTGPYDSYTFSFDLPFEWAISKSAKLNLFMAVSGGNILQAGQTTASNTFASGTITVNFNDVLIGVFPLTQIGNMSQELDIPVDAFKSIRTDGRMQLRISLDSPLACTLGQSVTTIISPTSNFAINHSTVAPEADLSKFPRPFYEKSVFQRSVVIVVPDAPTSVELQSAMTVASGLGNLSSNTLKLDLVPLSKLTPDLQQENLIFVGNVSSFPSLIQFDQFPLLPQNGKFNIPDGDSTDGVVELVNSPWSQFRAAMLVTGEKDEATLKAAQAVSTGVLIPGKQKNLSLIKTVNPNPAKISVPVDQTLGSLGYFRERLTGFGVNNVTYNFYIPSGQTVTSNAHFDLIFGHSALIDFDRSGIVVSVNNQPIGSIRLSDETASKSMNNVQFVIPPSTLISGTNRIDVTVTLQPLSNCNPPDFSALWVNIWPESALHLPLTEAAINLLSTLDLSRYPAPFVFNPNMANTAFVLQKNLPETWNNAVQIAAYLGDRTNGSISLLKTFYDGEIPETEKPLNHFIVIGYPVELQAIKQLKDVLPVPFQENSNDIVNPNMQVVFRFSKDTPVGYVELLQSPWSNDNVIILALGNNQVGVSWAASSLTNTILGSRLAGNFAMINEGDKVATTDTRTSSFVANPENVTAEPNSINPNPIDVIPQTVPVIPAIPVVERPSWILVVLGISIFAVLLILMIVLINTRRQNRFAVSGFKPDTKTTEEKDEDQGK